MGSQILLSLPIAGAAALVFFVYKRRATHRRTLERMRDRILFGIPARDTKERRVAAALFEPRA